MVAEERILVGSQLKRDGELTVNLLRERGFVAEQCFDIEQICQEIKKGAYCLLVAKEFLETAGVGKLLSFLNEEPAWSHLPIVILTASGDLQEGRMRPLVLLEPLKNVTVLEKPVRIPTLLSVLKAAIADRKRQYETKRLLSELESKNQELEQFSSIASHDLQEPLRTVMNYVQLLERRYREKFDDEGREYLRFVVEGVQRMRRLILDLLSYARAGTERQNLENVDVKELVNQVIGSLRVPILEARSEILISPDLPTIESDPTQLTQLFQNLIGNAIKYRRRDAYPRIEITSRLDSDMWVFSIKDNGVGIPREALGSIFRPFHRLHTRDEIPGTGIGLTVCERIVKRLGGRIWAESEAGKGSIFYFTLPASHSFSGAVASGA